MRLRSGICIELNQDRSIFLVKNGEFVQGTPAGTPSIGEEASFYPVEKQSKFRWEAVMAPVIAAAAAVAFFVSFLFPEEEASNYVQVEINPGIELGLNDQYEVVSIRELNRDGHDLIHELGEWENDSLIEVLNRVFKLAVTEQTEQITITSVEEDGNKLDQSIKDFALSVSSIIENENMAIQMKEATREQWRQSKEELVPMGQLVDKAETLKIQKQPDEQAPAKKSEAISEPKAKESTNTQETSNDNKVEDQIQQQGADKKEHIKQESKDAKQAEKSIVPSAEKKTNDVVNPSSEQPKAQNQDRMKESSTKNKDTFPVEKQQEKAEPKNVPPKAEEKGKPADAEQKKNEEKSQQNKKEASDAGPKVKKEPQNPPGQQKDNDKEKDKEKDQDNDKEASPNQGKPQKEKEQKKNENSADQGNSLKNKEKE